MFLWTCNFLSFNVNKTNIVLLNKIFLICSECALQFSERADIIEANNIINYNFRNNIQVIILEIYLGYNFRNNIQVQ